MRHGGVAAERHAARGMFGSGRMVPRARVRGRRGSMAATGQRGGGAAGAAGRWGVGRATGLGSAPASVENQCRVRGRRATRQLRARRQTTPPLETFSSVGAATLSSVRVRVG
jgi:hypothetical protein